MTWSTTRRACGILGRESTSGSSEPLTVVEMAAAQSNNTFRGFGEMGGGPPPEARACTAAPNVADALRAAQTVFPPDGGRRRLILLYQPDYCNRDFEYHDGECRGYRAAEETARTIRDAGTRIVVYDGERIGYRYYRFSGSPYVGDAQPLASTDADVVLDGLEQWVLRLRRKECRAPAEFR